MNIADLRRNYTRGGLSEEEAHPNPVEQFRIWFNQAVEADLCEPNAMTLATVDSSMLPNIRVVLLKAFDERGFVFYTNYESQKGKELECNPQAALHFAWLPLERQVKLRGRVEKVSRQESLSYFLSRPWGNRLGAWVSQQSKVITSRKLLEMKWEEMKAKFGQGEIPLPSFWGGYRVVPSSFEFWQGRENRLHDRIAYHRDNENSEWVRSRLSP